MFKYETNLDSTVKIWELSEDCFVKDTTEFVQSYSVKK